MTYCPPHVEEFEFTAFQGADLLGEGDHELNCGDCFAMPASATVCVTVTDNDSTLSGDAWRNEYGDDRSWQIADIEVDGTLLHDDTKIYAEEYYVLHDQHGNCYYLIEIETVGSENSDRDDFYTFYGDVPPAGAELTVVGRGNVCGNWLDYKCLSAGLKWDLDENCAVTIEAEDMALWGYKVDDLHAASGGEVIRLKKASGEASVTFGAEDGRYDLDLAYVDENDGEGSIEVWINGALIHAIELDQNNNGNGNDWSSVSTVRIEDIELAQGDEIVLKGTRDAWEMARIDAMTFTQIKNVAPVAVDDVAQTDEDSAVQINIIDNDSDEDGDPLILLSAGGEAIGTAFAVTSASGRTGSISVTAAGVLTFQPDPVFNEMAEGETDTVTVAYQISDGNGETAEAVATVTINGVNDAPVAEDDAFVVPESGESILDVLLNDSDPEGDPLTIELLTQPLEGSVTLDQNGQVVFDPLDDFLTLIDGQTATVTFEYQISDGQFTDTATVSVTVIGDGVCEPTPIEVSALGFLDPVTPMTVTLEAPDHTCDGTAEFTISAVIGDPGTTRYNVIYIMDISGSTGVADSFSAGKTVLEAEVEALNALTADIVELGLPEGSVTITVIPFNDPASITEPSPFGFPVHTFGDDEALDAADIETVLGGLEATGETNYLAAIATASATVQSLEAQHGDATNLVYFLSDGNPFPEGSQPPFIIDAFGTFLKSQATIHAVGMGDLVASTDFLDPIDTTGGAQIVGDEDALASALREAPVEDSAILSAELAIFDDGGALIDTLVFTGEDFDETPFGFDLSVEGVTGLDPRIGALSNATLTVELDGDGDGIADDTVTVSADIEGISPLSLDL